MSGFIFEYRKVNILGGKGFLEEKHRCGLVTKETWLCIRKHSAVTCHLSVETLLIASDKCPDLYLSIGRTGAHKLWAPEED